MIASFPHYMLRWVERSGSFHKTIIKRSPAWVLSLRAQIFRRFQKYQVFDLRPSKKTSTGSFGENFTTPRSTVYRQATTFIQSIFSTRRRKASTYFRFQNLRKQDSNQKTRSQSTLCKTVSLGRWIRISSRGYRVDSLRDGSHRDVSLHDDSLRKSKILTFAPRLLAPSKNIRIPFERL